MTLSAPQPLGPHNLSDAFDSGAPSLDTWLKRRAPTNQARGAARTFVTCDGDRIVGYYALASSAIAAAATPGRFRRNVPDPITVVVQVRLAVARSHQGQGLGRALFQDTVERVMQAADAIGVRGMIVHALSEQVRAFYLSLGLDPSPLDPMTLMATLADLRSSIAELD